jgi:8-oxo-dGTP diphosphatase
MPATDLERFPRPAVAIDLAILTVTGAAENPELRILVQDREDPTGRVLPGGFVRERRTVARTVQDVLRRKVGIKLAEGARPRLLRLFDDPARDDRTWVMSVAHSLSLRESDLQDARGDLIRVEPDGRLADAGPLLFDHDQIVAAAVAAIRSRYDFRYRFRDAYPDPDRFLSEPFTLHQLRKVHGAVIGDDLHKDNFNRRMAEYLEPVIRDGDVALSSNLRGRPATLYRHRLS